MHEPASRIYFSSRDGKDSPDQKLFKASYYYPTGTELLKFVREKAKSQPVFIKEIGVGFGEFVDAGITDYSNVYYIFLFRHPLYALKSLAKLDPYYPDASFEYKALLHWYRYLERKKQYLTLIHSIDFTHNPVATLSKIARWSGLTPIDGLSEFRQPPPEEWKDHTQWCKNAIESVRIKPLMDPIFEESTHCFPSGSTLELRWRVAYEESMQCYTELLNALNSN